MITRKTEKIRQSAGIEDDDPLAPVCDALDHALSRMDGLERSMQAMIKAAAIQAAVPDVVASIKDWIWRALFAALLAFLIALYALVNFIEQRGQARVDEKISELNMRYGLAVEQRARELAEGPIRKAEDARILAQSVINDKDGDPDVRALVSAILEGSRSDALVMWKFLKNRDPLTSILARLPLNLEPAEVASLYQQVWHAGYIRGDWWKQNFPTKALWP